MCRLQFGNEMKLSSSSSSVSPRMNLSFLPLQLAESVFPRARVFKPIPSLIWLLGPRAPGPRVGPTGPLRTCVLAVCTNIFGVFGYKINCVQLLYNPRVKKSKTFDVKVPSVVEASPTSRTGIYRVMTVKTQYNNIVLSVRIAVIQPNCHLLCGNV